jgi:hypothetical protein
MYGGTASRGVAGQPLVKASEQSEASGRPVNHLGRDRAIKHHHRVARVSFQQSVESEDLRPVRLVGGRCLVVHRCDRGLQLVFADRPVGQRLEDEGHALCDQRPGPPRAVLLGDAPR